MRQFERIFYPKSIIFGSIKQIRFILVVRQIKGVIPLGNLRELRFFIYFSIKQVLEQVLTFILNDLH